MNLTETWLIHATAASIVWFGLALLISLLSPRSSAALRHAVWTTAFAGCLLYAGALLLPKWQLAVFETSVPERATISAAPGSPPIQAGPTATTDQPSSGLEPTRSKAGLRAIWPIAWSIGAAFLLARLLLGLTGLWRATSNGQLVPENLLQMPHTPRVRVFRSAAIHVPVTWGLFRPCILVPANFLSWPRHEQQFALRHELAHILRSDWIVQILAQLVRALFWFNPLASIALRQLTLEQEKAADDFVITQADATSYADALLAIVQKIQSSRMAFAALPVLRRGSLETRIRALLDQNVTRRPVNPRTACLLGLLVALGAAAALVDLTAKEARPRLSKMEERFVGTWQGGGMLPSVITFREDGTYQAQPYGNTNPVLGDWKIEGNLLTSSARYPTNKVSTRRILQVSSNFFQWQLVGEASPNIFGYHRLTNIQLGTIAGVVQRQGKPLSDTLVLLEPVSPDGSLLPSTEVRSDRDGRFAFHGLAPGLYRISRQIQWDTATDRGSTTTATWTHHQIVELEKDKTREITLGSAGRTLTGELLPPAGLAQSEVAFGAGDFRFLTPAQRPLNAPNPVYVLELRNDGTFEIHDVPPGTYNLYVSVRRSSDPLDSPEFAEIQAGNLQVPPGSTDFSLGRFELLLRNR